MSSTTTAVTLRVAAAVEGATCPPKGTVSRERQLNTMKLKFTIILNSNRPNEIEKLITKNVRMILSTARKKERKKTPEIDQVQLTTIW